MDSCLSQSDLIAIYDVGSHTVFCLGDMKCSERIALAAQILWESRANQLYTFQVPNCAVWAIDFMICCSHEFLPVFTNKWIQ